MWLFRRNKATAQPDVDIEKEVAEIDKKAPVGTEGSDEVPDTFTTEDKEETLVAPAEGATHVMTKQEVELVRQMKEKLPPDARPKTALDVTFEWTLLRFLRARKYDLDAAIEMYLKMLEWRIENKVDEMLATPDPREHVFQCVCPHRNHGVDREGHPVYFERTGMIRVGDLLKHMDEMDIVWRHVRMMEYMAQRTIAQSQQTDKYIGKSVMILDLTGMRYTIETAGMRAFRRTTHIDQNNYPECLHRMVIINAPLSFRGVWAVIKPWLDVKTRAKVENHGSNYQKRLQELVAPEHTPTIFGGECTCEGKFDNGDTCFAPVRPVGCDPALVPPAWPYVERKQTDVEREISATTSPATAAPVQQS
jgi:hypothetical protein